MQQAYGLTALDRVLQKTPFSFDVSVWEFFWPLAQGAALVRVRRQEEQLEFAFHAVDVLLDHGGLTNRVSIDNDVDGLGGADHQTFQELFEDLCRDATPRIKRLDYAGKGLS